MAYNFLFSSSLFSPGFVVVVFPLVLLVNRSPFDGHLCVKLKEKEHLAFSLMRCCRSVPRTRNKDGSREKSVEEEALCDSAWATLYPNPAPLGPPHRQSYRVLVHSQPKKQSTRTSVTVTVTATATATGKPLWLQKLHSSRYMHILCGDKRIIE